MTLKHPILWLLLPLKNKDLKTCKKLDQQKKASNYIKVAYKTESMIVFGILHVQAK